MVKKKTKAKTPIRKKMMSPKISENRSKSFEAAEAALMDALKAEPKDLKVPISLRLDGDVYLDLKKGASSGLGDGKYQVYLMQILRNHFYGEEIVGLSQKVKSKAG